MTLVYLGIALGVVVIISEIWRRIAAAMDRPLTDYDLRCAAIDEELDAMESERRARRGRQ